MNTETKTAGDRDEAAAAVLTGSHEKRGARGVAATAGTAQQAEEDNRPGWVTLPPARSGASRVLHLPDLPSTYTMAVDFDGVLHRTDHRGWMGGEVYGDPVPGSMEALQELIQDYCIFVLTARGRRFHQAVAEFVTLHSGIRTVVDDYRPDQEYWLVPGTILVTNRKFGSAGLIDDKAVEFRGNWAKTHARVRHPEGVGASRLAVLRQHFPKTPW
ncbi:hypothetical protein F7Q99_36715 [Streptomyces kaniharaensis]|uniref:Uncharacterized protein n=1 Tax=Streptomyces kaniharaensis TaxID=212423 RepID=A0A6N7L5E5_9ACTN|nr:hypothetical protein [Streptomyces kaniharaensis]MQS17584.1 hypothetical protein [Streptomyces kaniharaensis]